MFGLRIRLVATIGLATAVGVLLAAWSGADSAASALVEADQAHLAAAFSARIEAVAPALSHPPDQTTLDQLRVAAGDEALAVSGELRSSAGDGADLVTDELREAVGSGGATVTQRVVVDGTPYLLIGAPVMRTAPTGERSQSGIEVYAVVDLSAVEHQVAHVFRAALLRAALALPVAVALALSAAGGVLRPVRRLRDNAVRLAEGDLDARVTPRGRDELADLTATMNEMAGSLQWSVTEMARLQADARRFAADVAHELRTPLSTLTAVLDVLAATAGQTGPDERESVELAISETERLVRLVEDLVEVSRFDAGSAQLRIEEVELGDAVRDSLRARGWSRQVEVIATNPVVIDLDRRRLDVIVANLVGNAISHGDPPVRVLVAGWADRVGIEVTDNGPGLPADVLPRVFDRFYRGGPARARTTGSGLGLAIALENARLHGGDLRAASGEGGGARFVLRIPRPPMP